MKISVLPLKVLTMECRECHKELIPYLEGALTGEDLARVEHHLAGCRGCRQFADYLRETLLILGEETRAEPAPYFYTRVKARLERETEQTMRPVWRTVLQPAFFSFLLLLGIYTGIRLGGVTGPALEERRTTDRFVPWMNELETEPIENFLMQ